MTNPGRPLITEIPIDKIYPHSHNPRKNLGELSELANSIKQSGVLQNLTVIPGRFLHPDEYVDSLPAGADPREALDMLRADPSLAYDDTDDSYTVIIGHRRLAAARLAGLSTIPAAVVAMDFRTQLATMMAENVQRADLTPFEQADGFQLMMDLGMSADEVARETGFSVSTVRRRVKLTQLDRDKLTEGAAYTLFDLERIAGISSQKERDRLIGKLGTDGFGLAVSQAESDQARENTIEFVTTAVKTAFPQAEKINSWQIGGAYSDYDEVAATEWLSPGEPVSIPEVPRGKQVIVYGLNSSWADGDFKVRVILGAKRPSKADAKDEPTPRQKENAAIKEMRAEALKTARATYWVRRCDFIRALDEKTIAEHADVLVMGIALAHTNLYDRQLRTMQYLLGFDVKARYPSAQLWNDIAYPAKSKPLKTLLCMIYATFDVPPCGEVDVKNGKPVETQETAYQILEALGYEKGADEVAFFDGSAEIFKLSHFRAIYRKTKEAAEEAELTAEAEEAAAEAALTAGA